MIFGIYTTRDISKSPQISLAQRLVKLCKTILKYRSWYLCQISLQIMLLPMLIMSAKLLNADWSMKREFFSEFCFVKREKLLAHDWSSGCPATAYPIACVASVPVRKKSSQTISGKQAARKLGREIEGTLARRPPIFEKRPLFLTRAD